MPTYYIEMSVDFAGHIEADSEADAEQKAFTAWGESADATISYDGVNDISVELDDDAWCEDHETYECGFCNNEEEE